MRKCAVILTTLVLLLLPCVAYCEANEGTQMYVVVNDDSYLRGRLSPNTHSEVLCRFYAGDVVTVLNMENRWAKIAEGGEAQYSYVSWDYLSSYPAGESEKARVIADGRVRVRQSPDGRVIGYVRNGDELSITLWFDGWAKTQKGWVSDQYLESVE